MRTVLSDEPDAIRLPSGEKATDKTQPVCPVNGWPSGAPVSESQMRTVLSDEPDAIRLPSGEKATDETKPVCPRINFCKLSQLTSKGPM
jgi:hypothetical protein